MKESNINLCADAGSKYCPCHLAYSGDCIKCPIIRGEGSCNCLWQGVCIYSELQHNRNCKIKQREEHLCDIKELNNIKDNLYLLKIQVPKNILIDLSSPGAYVLIKSEDKNKDIFNAPISVMDVDFENSILKVMIKSVGIKTKNIINYNRVWLKGPYFNGIFGIKQIKKAYKENTVVVANGLSQVNCINVVKRLIENKNNVEVFINSEADILDEVINKLKSFNINIYITNLYQDENFLEDYIKRNNIYLVYSSGSDRFNKFVMKVVDKVDENISLAISNNNLICCGEGICGSCTVNINGEKIKSCKAQIDSRKFLNSRDC